jgi:O-antigen/teichoic acid export membrane protein
MAAAEPVLARAKAIVRRFSMRGGSLGQRAFRAGTWSLIAYGGANVLSLMRSVILARLLMPADFGLLALADVAIGLLTIMTYMGLTQYAIYKTDAGDDLLNTVWTLSVLRGLLLAGVTFLIAGPVGSFYRAPELSLVLRVMAVTFVVTGFGNPGLILLNKELEFRKLGIFGLSVSFFGTLATVALAWTLRSVWALVAGTLITAALEAAGSYWLHPYRPRWLWRPQLVRSALGYGKYITGSGVLSYLLTQGDNAVVGRMLGTTALGYYNFAYRLANLPTTSITHVIGQVAFPAYAKLQNDRPALISAYLRVLKLTAVLTVPALLGIMALGADLVLVLYGPKWAPMTVPLMIMCIAGLERSITAPVAPLFNAMGRPRTVFFLLVAKVVLLAAAIFPLTARHGIVGTSIAGALVSVLLMSYTFPLVARLLGFRVWEIVKAIAGPASAGGVMALVLVLAKLSGWFAPGALTLATLIALGALVYVVSLTLLDRGTVQEVVRLVRSQFAPAGAATPASGV